MPTPSSSLTTVRSDLAAAFSDFDLDMNRAGFIGYQVLRPFNVPNQRGIFGRLERESLLSNKETIRASGSGYNRDSFEFTDEAYSCKEHGFEGVVDDRDRNMYRDLLDAELVTVQRLRSIVMSNAERRVRDLIQTAVTFTPTAITNEWDDHVNAVPITDVEAAINRLWAKGIVANALVLTRDQYRNLRLCAQVVAKVHSSGAGSSILPGNINLELLQKAFDLKYILVAGGIENIANDGQAGSYKGIWSNEYAAVTRIAETDDIAEPCLGRTFNWTEDGSEIGGTVESYYDDSKRVEIYRVRHDVDEHLIFPEAVELLSNAITI